MLWRPQLFSNNWLLSQVSAHQVSKNPGLPLDFGQKFVDVCFCKHTQVTFVELTSICEISRQLIIISAYSRMILYSKWANVIV